MEVNNIFYESTAIGHHYRSKKSLALAYLMTIGSKALVLTEASDGDSDPACMIAVQKSFDDEAAIQRKIIHEEQVEQFRRSLDDKPGVLVMKKGRNGEFRQIHIRVKDDPKKGIKAVVWHSRLGSKKSFVLDPTMSVRILKEDGSSTTIMTTNNSSHNGNNNSQSGATTPTNGNSSEQSTPRHNASQVQQQQQQHHHHHHQHGFVPGVPVLCLGNHSRQLIIQFMSPSEANVCIHLLHALGIKDPTVCAVATMDTD